MGRSFESMRQGFSLHGLLEARYGLSDYPEAVHDSMQDLEVHALRQVLDLQEQLARDGCYALAGQSSGFTLGENKVFHASIMTSKDLSF
jgi:hypothetical protein